MGGREIPVDAARANELAEEHAVGPGFGLLALEDRAVAQVLTAGGTTHYAPTEAPSRRAWRMWLASR